jgi:hypothetical protein
MKKECATISGGKVIFPNDLGGTMKTDVEVKEVAIEEISPRFKEAFFKLEECGLFGAVLFRKHRKFEVVQYIASRNTGNTFIREVCWASGYLSSDSALSLAQQIRSAPCLAQDDKEVPQYVLDKVKELNRTVESWRSNKPRRVHVYREILDSADNLSKELRDERLEKRPYNLD